MNNLKNDLRYPIVLRYFEALDANNWDRISDILAVAAKYKPLEDAILSEQESMDWSESLTQQFLRRYEQTEPQLEAPMETESDFRKAEF